MRLIDANALMREMMVGLKSAYLLVQDAPTVDAVEVVRCCSCTKHDHDGGDGYCNRWDKWTKMSDFCSYGERREGE